MKNLLLGSLLVVAPAFAQPASPKPAPKVTKLGASFAEIDTGMTSNVGVLYGDDGILVVDPGMKMVHARVKEAIATLSKKSVRFVVITHWHYDHAEDNATYHAEGVPVIAQDNVYRRMSTPQTSPMDGSAVPASPPAALPTLSYDHEMTLHLDGDVVHLLHVEHAHTDGDTIVHFEKANVVMMGDLYFSAAYPLVDVPAGGSLAGMIAGCDRALKIGDDKTQFIPGHGPVSNRARLVEYRDMLKGTFDRLTAMKKKNMTVEQVVAAKPAATYDAVWGKGFFKADSFVKWAYATIDGPTAAVK